MRLKVRRRTALAALGVLVLIVAAGSILLYSPLTFTAFQGAGVDTAMAPSIGGKPVGRSGLTVTAGSEGTFTYRVTLQNWGLLPIRVTGVEDVRGRPLRPVEVQAVPDQRDPARAFHPFTLVPFQERDLLITSRLACGGLVESDRLQFSVLGIPRHEDVPLLVPLQVEGVPC